MAVLHDVPGFRRSVRFVAGEGAVLAELEDDFHCMSVRLEHDGVRATAVLPAMQRAPWTTCPGAIAQLQQTFVGQPLSAITARHEKQRNCTHLHDLIVGAAAHAHRPGSCTYAIAVSDPVEGERHLEITCNGAPVHFWTERSGVITRPEGPAGTPVMALRIWIGTLPKAEQEAARLLQVAAVISHGRTFPWHLDAAPSGMPATCHTWQPEQAAKARRKDAVFDFSRGDRRPLD